LAQVAQVAQLQALTQEWLGQIPYFLQLHQQVVVMAEV
jgi:hypothetical protein